MTIFRHTKNLDQYLIDNLARLIRIAEGKEEQPSWIGTNYQNGWRVLIERLAILMGKWNAYQGHDHSYFQKWWDADKIDLLKRAVACLNDDQRALFSFECDQKQPTAASEEESTVKNYLQHTRAALVAYDASQPERDALWNAVQDAASFMAAENRASADAKAVQAAFFQDTKGYNRGEDCAHMTVPMIRGMITRMDARWAAENEMGRV